MRRLVLLALLLGAACSSGDGGEEPGRCVATKDCAAGEVCDRGACVKPAPRLCADDAECGPGNACLSSVCVGGTACRAQGDCGSGESCDVAGGMCVVPSCGPKGECPNAGFCDVERNRCTRTRTCLNDGQCDAPGGTCVEGTCVPGCGLAGCADGLSCDTTTGRCGPSTSCSTDAQCEPPDRICASGRCVSGCLSVGCNTDETCDVATGRCRPAGCTATCASWEVCGTSGLCEPRACDTDAECDAPRGRCETNVCIAGCGTNGCGELDSCDDATGECVRLSGPLDASCASNAQCDSSFCLVPGSSEPLPGRCSVSCGTTSDCAPGRRCTEPDATPGLKACLSAADGAVVGPKVRGASCSGAAPEQCQSGLCVTNGAANGFCFDECSRDTHCRQGEVCRAIPTGNQTAVQLCAGPEAGALDVFPSECSQACASGLCDDLAEYCFSACCSSADCVTGSVCLAMLPVFTADGSQSTTLMKGCVPAVAVGTARVGAACSLQDGTNCRSNLCISTRADGSEGPGYCSDSCCVDADCGAGFVCGAGYDEGSGYSFGVCLKT